MKHLYSYSYVWNEILLYLYIHLWIGKRNILQYKEMGGTSESSVTAIFKALVHHMKPELERIDKFHILQRECISSRSQDAPMKERSRHSGNLVTTLAWCICICKIYL